MGTVESLNIKPRRRESNSKLNAKPPGSQARGVGSGSGRGLGGTCRTDSPSARRLERARGAGEAGPAAEAARRSRATTRPGAVLSAAAPCAQVGSPPKLRSGRRSRCPKSRDRGSVAAGRPSLPVPAARRCYSRRASWGSRGPPGLSPRPSLYSWPTWPWDSPRRTRTRRPSGGFQPRTRATAAGLLATPKVPTVVRAHEAGDPAERSGAASLPAGGEAGFWSIAGSSRMVTERMGGLGSHSLKPQGVWGVCSGSLS